MEVNYCVICSKCDPKCLRWIEESLYDSFCFVLSMTSFTFDEFNSSSLCSNCYSFLVEISTQVQYFKELQRKINEFQNAIKSSLQNSQQFFATLNLTCQNFECAIFNRDLNLKICKALEINLYENEPTEDIKLFPMTKFHNYGENVLSLEDQMNGVNSEFIERDFDFIPSPSSSTTLSECSNDYDFVGSLSASSKTTSIATRQVVRRSMRRRQRTLTEKNARLLMKEATERISFVHLKRLEDMTTKELSQAFKQPKIAKIRQTNRKKIKRKNGKSSNDNDHQEYECRYENCDSKGDFKSHGNHERWIQISKEKKKEIIKQIADDKGIFNRYRNYPVVVNDSGLAEFKCNFHNCDFQNSNKSVLYEHVRLNHKSTTLKSHIKQSLKIPMYSVRNENREIVFFCDYENCDYKNSNEICLIDHLRSTHQVVIGESALILGRKRKRSSFRFSPVVKPDGSTFFICNFQFCDFQSTDKISVGRHFDRIHRKDGETVYKSCDPQEQEQICPYCEKSFASIKILRIHIEKIHEKCEVVCDTCGEKRKNLAALLVHKHRCERSKDLICKKCGKTFLYGSYQRLARHRVEEHGEEATVFQCELCPKNYMFKNILNHHMKQIHGEGNFSCDLCEKKYKSLHKMKRHRKEVHFPKPKIKKFACSTCNMMFADRYKLNRHEKLHTKEKPFLCSTCGKCFARNDALTEHSRVHYKS